MNQTTNRKRRLPLPPVQVLQHYTKRYPHAWRELEHYFVHRERLGFPPWPPYVFVPVAGAYAVVGNGGLVTDLNQAKDIPIIAALGAWRPTQTIYEFNPHLLEALLHTPITGDIPHKVLHQLPEWCVYIETPPLPCHGFWAHLEWDMNKGHEELRLLFLFDNGPPHSLLPVIIYLGGTIEEGIARAWESASRYVQALNQPLQLTDDPGSLGFDILLTKLDSLVSVLLYLCTPDPDYKGATGHPKYPTPKKTKKGFRLFPAPGPRLIKVGDKIGARIKKHSSYPSTLKEIDKSQRRSPRPHIRRGHWHHYWTGPRTGPRNLVIKWIHPLIVGGAA